MKFILIFLSFAFFQLTFSQSNIENSSLLKEMVQLKKQMTKDYKLKEFYVIQLHSGNKEKAQEIKEDIDKFIRKIGKKILFKKKRS